MLKKTTQNIKSPRVRYLLAFSIFIISLLGVFISYRGKVSYNQAISYAEHDATRLSNILGEHVELSFLGVDLSLRRIIERQFYNSIFSNYSREYSANDFRAWLNETPQIAGLAMIDEQGQEKIVANKTGYENWIDYNKNPMGQKLFKYMRDTDNNDVFIGRYTSEDKTPLIIMSRRYNKNVNGEFGGIVVAAIDPKYFIEFYESIAFGTQRFMSVMLFDKTILSSSSYKSYLNESIGRNIMSDLISLNSQDNKISTLVKRARTTDSDKMVAVKLLPHVPIAVQVTLDGDDFLNDWRKARLGDLVFFGLFIVFSFVILLFSLLMARQIEKSQRSEKAAILASQAKSEFLANMSHELRTPLNAIIGFSEMINSGYFGELNSHQKERIYDINLCGNHLLQLITDILEFSKGDAGKLELVEERVNIEDLVNESVRIMKEKIKSKEINLNVRLDPSLPMLLGDGRKIRQILINLLSNSFKFTPAHGVITVGARRTNNSSIAMFVTDTGIGIAESDIPKALSVFGQVHRAKSHEGTGLGLPLCKMYAELHDGKLTLTSRQNEGTTVEVIFPSHRAVYS